MGSGGVGASPLAKGFRHPVLGLVTIAIHKLYVVQ